MEKENQIEQWISLYTTELLNRAIYLVSDTEEAKDLVQDVFLAAYSGYHSFKGNSSAKTWLYTILKNKVADFYRKKYKNPLKISLDSFFDAAGNWKDSNNLLQAWDEAAITGNYAAFDRILEYCIEKLEPKWRIPIKLYYLQEKKAPEVCQEIGITTTNLWKILQRARLQIRACLETKELENND
jgi:RNA polymerase sigma-70 factor (ECF subfamily)